ncbi:hypothetical protein COCNU_scaffold008850G000020 [Cocos nucifera]|nr:hypothetical protein [Cocos nucifera]
MASQDLKAPQILIISILVLQTLANPWQYSCTILLSMHTLTALVQILPPPILFHCCAPFEAFGMTASISEDLGLLLRTILDCGILSAYQLHHFVGLSWRTYSIPIPALAAHPDMVSSELHQSSCTCCSIWNYASLALVLGYWSSCTPPL